MKKSLEKKNVEVYSTQITRIFRKYLKLDHQNPIKTWFLYCFLL